MKSLLVAVFCTLLVACSADEPAPLADTPDEPRPLVVFATSYPLAYFTERIGGDAVVVEFPVPAGVDPAHWSAGPDEIAQAQAADLLLRHGVGDPAWLDLASLRRDRIVDTTAGVRDRLIEQETATHQHGPHGEHSHGELAGTPWLDPTLAREQARAIAGALSAGLPARAERFAESLAALVADLEELDRGQMRAASALGDTPILFSHPVYDYLQVRYRLNGRSVTWEPDAMPEESEWRALERLLQEHPARVMLWEAEPLAETTERLAALGIESRVHAPCANRPAQGDWLGVMRANRSRLVELAARR